MGAVVAAGLEVARVLVNDRGSLMGRESYDNGGSSGCTFAISRIIAPFFPQASHPTGSV